MTFKENDNFNVFDGHEH